MCVGVSPRQTNEMAVKFNCRFATCEDAKILFTTDAKNDRFFFILLAAGGKNFSSIPDRVWNRRTSISVASWPLGLGQLHVYADCSKIPWSSRNIEACCEGATRLFGADREE